MFYEEATEIITEDPRLPERFFYEFSCSQLNVKLVKSKHFKAAEIREIRNLVLENRELGHSLGRFG